MNTDAMKYLVRVGEAKKMSHLALTMLEDKMSKDIDDIELDGIRANFSLIHQFLSIENLDVDFDDLE